jgi:hypothetical protein
MKKHMPITILNNPNAVPRNSDDTYFGTIALWTVSDIPK